MKSFPPPFSESLQQQQQHDSETLQQHDSKTQNNKSNNSETQQRDTKIWRTFVVEEIEMSLLKLKPLLE